MATITAAQRRVLQALHDNLVEAFQNGDNRWRWYIKLRNGMIMKIAGNDTMVTLVARGALRRTPTGSPDDRRVHLTDAGRRLLDLPSPKKEG
jgi:hypothetical protein